MKLIGLIQEELNKIQETPDHVTIDGIKTDRTDSGAHPFAYNRETGNVDIGDENLYHVDAGISGVNHVYPGRLFSKDKIITFWTYPNNEEFKDIISQIEKNLDIQIMNNGWRIEIYPDLKRGTQDYNTNIWSSSTGPQLIPVEEYTGSKNVSEILRKIHAMSPTEKPKYKKIYTILKQQLDRLDDEQMEIFKALDSKFGMRGFGSDKYAKNQPIQYHQALRQEGIDDIVNDEVSNYLQENPDTSYHPDSQERLSYDDSGAYAFGYTDDGEFMVSDEGDTHGYLVSNSGENQRREGIRYGGRIWTNDNVMSFWEYPSPNMIRDIAQDLENELGISIINNSNFVIETLVDVVGEPVWDDEDEYKTDEMHWAKGDDSEFLTVPEYEKLHGEQISQRSAEELAKQHVASPMDKPHRKPIKGSGSSKYGIQKPLAFRQALMRSEGLENIVKDEVALLDETPDSITDYTGIFRYKDEIDWEDRGAYAFGYLENEMMVSDEKGTHEDLGGKMGKRTFRRDYTYAGRIWTEDKIISFWEYPSPNMILKVIGDLRKKLHLNINNDYKIETLPSKVTTGISDRGPYDWVYQDTEKATFLTPTEYSKLSEVQQRSPEELAKQHVVSPMLKGKSSGSKKQPLPLKYKQSVLKSESANIFEQVEKILNEWTEDQMYDIYEMRDEIMRDTIDDFMTKPIGSRQPWKLIPFGRLKKVWEDAQKMGVVRDQKGLDMIQARMIKNLLKLDVNTELMGHTQWAVSDEDLEGYTREEFDAKMNDSNVIYFDDDAGQFRLSDYGLKPLWDIAQNLVEEEDDIRRIMYIDQMLNVIHMRSDMAGNFVEGGSAALSQLSGEHAEIGEGLNEKSYYEFRNET